jgi:large subunit ribosomal protein L10
MENGVATETEGEAEVRAGPRKQEAVARLTDQLARATSAVVTDYRGLSVKQLEDLRSRLRHEGIDYVVVKNTLARRAAVAAGVDPFVGVLTGPVGLALGYGDLSAPARLLNDFFRVTRQLPMVAVLVEGQVLDAAGARTLAELPSREVLLSRLAGTLQAPLTSLAGALESILSNFAATLDAYGQKLAAI